MSLESAEVAGRNVQRNGPWKRLQTRLFWWALRVGVASVVLLLAGGLTLAVLLRPPEFQRAWGVLVVIFLAAAALGGGLFGGSCIATIVHCVRNGFDGHVTVRKTVSAILAEIIIAVIALSVTGMCIAVVWQQAGLLFR